MFYVESDSDSKISKTPKYRIMNLYNFYGLNILI